MYVCYLGGWHAESRDFLGGWPHRGGWACICIYVHIYVNIGLCPIICSLPHPRHLMCIHGILCEYTYRLTNLSSDNNLIMNRLYLYLVRLSIYIPCRPLPRCVSEVLRLPSPSPPILTHVGSSSAMHAVLVKSVIIACVWYIYVYSLQAAGLTHLNLLRTLTKAAKDYHVFKLQLAFCIARCRNTLLV